MNKTLTMKSLSARLDSLAKENAALKRKVHTLETQQKAASTLRDFMEADISRLNSRVNKVEHHVPKKPQGWYVPSNKQRWWLRKDGYPSDVTFDSREECSAAIDAAMARHATRLDVYRRSL